MANYRMNAIHAIDRRGCRTAVRAVFARPFSPKAQCRVLIYGHAHPICRSQIEPFFHHSDVFRERHGAEFRCRPVDDLLSGPIVPADVIMVQPWFTIDAGALERSLELLRARLPHARIIFLDSYAHNDLRLGRFVDPFIDLYYKKSLFKDRNEYLVARSGDTNLTEFYANICGVDVGPKVDWRVPASLLPKLRLSPNFFTSARFAREFDGGQMPVREGRQIDLQSRLGGRGSAWYSAMRGRAQECVEAIPGLRRSPPGHLSNADFMAELSNSKLCFSPFGFGELCWRDIEAFQGGAVLVKPDMSHLETMPNLYEAGATYLPVRWDFADLEAVIRNALADEEHMALMAYEAWSRVSRYVREGYFVDSMHEIFVSSSENLRAA
jgi:hypothetical protein